MRIFSIMLLAIVLISCVTREPTQYHGEWVELIDIREEWRLTTERNYFKQLVYVYRTEQGRLLELSYPLNKTEQIGSRHLMPIQR
jgi:hypothetical protein